MPLLAKSQSGTVTGLWGKAFIQLPDGTLKPLHMGDQVKWADQLLTTQDGIVQITRPDGKVQALAPDDVDRDIAAVDQGEIDIAPAAGLTGGGEGGLTPGLRVDRVSESVTPLDFAFETARQGPGDLIGGVEQPFLANDTANPAPAAGPSIVSITSGTVSESGLPGGVPDAGTSDATVATGQIVVANASSITVTGGPSGVLTSDGIEVVWRSDGNGGLIGAAGASTVATLTVDGSGNYTFSLLAPLQHSAQGQDTLGLTFDVAVANGQGATATGSFTVGVVDDMPGAVAPVTDSVEVLDTNLLIMLDVSGSMNGDSGIGDLTRLEAAIQSINTLLEQYDKLGDVKVRLVTFSESAQTLGDTWVSVAQAKALLASVTASGGTNYDDALDAAQKAFASDGLIDGAQNVSYFFSDGNPTLSSAHPVRPENGGDNNGAEVNEDLGDGIDATEEAAWISFLETHQINSYAIGLGTDPNKPYLDPVAYDGQAAVDRDGVVVTDLNQLSSVLSGTVKQSASGSLLGPDAHAGADGYAHIATVTIDGVVYAYDADQPVITVTTALGQLVTIDFNAATYSYALQTGVPSTASETIGFTVADKDGDTVASSLTLNVERSVVTTGTAASETLTGDAAVANLMFGRDGDDRLIGGQAADQLHGGQGNDVLIGGAGDDVLTGGLGSDVFRWSLGDAGADAAHRAVDTIKDFDVHAASAGGDVLDLRDLLVGENTVGGVGNLGNYLDFDTSGSNTVIRISTTGGFVNGAYAPSADNQQIVLEGVNLRGDLGLAADATGAQIISRLIENGKLLVDNG